MSNVDTEKFRLRTFVERLQREDECEVVEGPVDLVDVGQVFEGNPKCSLIKNVGPEKASLVGNVMGSRKRMAMALDTSQADLLPSLMGRLKHPHKPVRVRSESAPVQQVVLQGDQADLCALPVHLQHTEDGAPYISASIDFAQFSNGDTNVGCRRIMLRGPRQAGVDMIAPSDIRAIYLDAVAKGQNMPVAYTVGSHPCDFIAAVSMTPPMDELEVIGAVRGEPAPIVKCVTNDLWVPADAEYVIEGYLSSEGHVEPEGPFGEYVGYYGIVKRNPVLHVTAVTHRKDALFQTVTIGGRSLAYTETSQLTTMKTESAAWVSLNAAVREPVAVCATPASGGMYNVRVSLRQRVPGEARNAIVAVFGSMAECKHVHVFDDDIDVFSDAQCEWAFATRFQGDRDLITVGGLRTIPLDPSLGGSRTGAKVGFDCTIPFGQRNSLEWSVPEPPKRVNDTVRTSMAERLKAGPASFFELMCATGTTDGREIVREMDKLYQQRRLSRSAEGRYLLDKQN